MENCINHYLIWKINSHSIQVIVAPRQSEHLLNDWVVLFHLAGKGSCWRSHTSQHRLEPEIPISALRTSHMFCDVQNVLEPQFFVVMHDTLNYQVDIIKYLSNVQNIYRQRLREWCTERCIKDASLLCSNEDNPQITDPVRIIATINFQLTFL